MQPCLLSKARNQMPSSARHCVQPCLLSKAWNELLCNIFVSQGHGMNYLTLPDTVCNRLLLKARNTLLDTVCNPFLSLKGNLKSDLFSHIIFSQNKMLKFCLTLALSFVITTCCSISPPPPPPPPHQLQHCVGVGLRARVRACVCGGCARACARDFSKIKATRTVR